ERGGPLAGDVREHAVDGVLKLRRGEQSELRRSELGARTGDGGGHPAAGPGVGAARSRAAGAAAVPAAAWAAGAAVPAGAARCAGDQQQGGDDPPRAHASTSDTTPVVCGSVTEPAPIAVASVSNRSGTIRLTPEALALMAMGYRTTSPVFSAPAPPPIVNSGTLSGTCG